MSDSHSLIQLDYEAGYGMAVFLWVQLFYLGELGDSADVNL